MTKTPLYTAVTEHTHRVFRRPALPPMAEGFAAAGLSPRARMSARFCAMCAAEEPHILEGQQIVFLRTLPAAPDIFTEAEWADLRAKHFLHESGYLSNLCPDYASVIAVGFDALREGVDEYTRADMDALQGLADRYRELALAEGRGDVAEVLSRVPAKGARSFREALQFFRILHFGLWLEGTYHNTVGRFDRWVTPYFEADLRDGRMTEAEAHDLLVDFFLSFNLDADLYPGIQQGDNGQSMMLGGDDGEGGYYFSRLTALCLQVSRENGLIDPKINLRVRRDTPEEVYRLGTELTAAGLGFPQYANDDVVIDGLVKLGYAPEDAREFSVAACWEFIIPGKGCDIANIAALSYPLAVDRALRGGDTADFAALQGAVKREIVAICDEIEARVKNLYVIPGPFTDLCFGGRDVSLGLDYNNYGIHGVGLATAADSLAAIRRWVYERGEVTIPELIAALDADFAGTPELLHRLRYESPKAGTAQGGEAEALMVWLGGVFADALAGRRNERGGCFRAGTGSAMFYLWCADEVGASPDGRRRGEPFAANYSPSLFADTDPVSVIRAFTRPDLRRLINGGPLTMEFHDKIFANPDGMEKVAALVRAFIEMGGHQLQLNAVNREVLLDAQAHPERYPRLIVRIWGWSAYFCALDKAYQDHVIRRQEYTV